MKVIKGNFKKDELPDHAGERLRYQLDNCDVLDLATGTYTLLFDSGDSIFILTNGDGAGDVLLNMEKAKMALMATVYEGEGDLK